MTRPHPLWGRTDDEGRAGAGSDSGSAVPVLLSLVELAEEVRSRGRANTLLGRKHSCAICIVHNIRDVLAHSLERPFASPVNNIDEETSEEGFVVDARSVLGRETSLLASCCKGLARLLDTARHGDFAVGAPQLNPEDQRAPVVMVRLIGNLVHRCRDNQDLLRAELVLNSAVTSVRGTIPSAAVGIRATPAEPAPSTRTGLRVLLGASSLAPAGAALRKQSPCRRAERRRWQPF